MNKIGRKVEEETLKRRIAISKLKAEYKDISQLDLRDKLHNTFNIEATRQTIWKDLQWLDTHNLTEYLGDNQQSLLEVDKAKVNTEITYNEDLRQRAKDAGDVKTEMSVGKLIKDLVTNRGILDKKIMEMELSKDNSNRPQYFVSIGKPRLIDMKFYRKKQKELRDNLAK